MFSDQLILISIALLTAVSVGGIAYGLLYSMIRDDRSEERVKKVASTNRRTARSEALAAGNLARKRRQMTNKLKQQQQIIDEKAQSANQAKAPLHVKLQRAGLDWEERKFYIVSVAFGIGVGIFAYVNAWPLYFVLPVALVAGLGFPRWVLGFLISKRQKAFLKEFPNALDVIVRGMKAGLPVNDCLGIIAREAAEPVRTEFKRVVEAQQAGLTLSAAVAKLFDRMPMPEVNFFVIMITIQAQAGGNLSEALGNLSLVVRDRKKMAAKIQAMSMEAKAGASIIGSLPVVVLLLVYLSTPEYISVMFTSTIGNIMLGACVFWMTVGVLVMRKMINFDF